ncbi:hypothetical protein TTHERM_00145780 (macronuclear) [Tetrahymena thermophila SB210]|uniref:WD domain, G-beta repeat protein n=1 Tax=Tetrahymena thermophila (strain SB210) TaxID=312017 RepID=I7LUB6_TETTS|nr:hypothetical protein TTHERM_00145780 [Tetrahymena thermophila SB210]EAR90973.3 hypothetical protein TTHERM_00145780 [Tetrahymena thermophila SB210]|eukprot:XP_001011218.3 hypothetical protein TTHERM_00145780 [Tetrahymena thermophila SB210]
MNSTVKETANFEKLVKIRIGEPLTAVEISQQHAIFGSISGYVGAYGLDTKELIYIQEVFEEIIRGIQQKENGSFNVLVGDHSLIQFYLDEMKQKERLIKVAFNNHTPKKPEICASTITFLSGNFVAMTQANPTQNKDAIYDSNDQQLKGILQVFQIDKQQWKHYSQFNLPQVCVPFDFDSDKMVWLEYKDQGVKEIQIYDLSTQKTSLVTSFTKKIEFISHVKLLQNFVIYVENHMHVKVFDLKTNKTTDLYSHNSTVQTIYCTFNGNAATKHQDEENIKFKFSEISLNQIVIHSVDFNCNYFQYSNQKLTHKIQVLKQQNVPDQLKQHKYIFDMGYPYYIKSKENIVAFTCDFGLCVLRL